MAKREPKFLYETDKTKTFINPYNFVRPDFKQEKFQDKDDSRYTGKLHCKIFIKTPIAILDTENEKVQINSNNHKTYSFYKTLVDGKEIPSIPGSSIRGSVRTMYETLTNSCFATLPENGFLSKRVEPINAYSPAILIKEDNKWVLYSAEKYKIQNNNVKVEINKQDKRQIIKSHNLSFAIGEYVNATINDEKKATNISKASGKTDFIVCIGEQLRDKDPCQAVFKKGKIINVDSAILTKAINGLEYSIDMYRNSSINKNFGITHTGYSSYDECKKNGLIPVWYKDIGNNDISLSMAAIGRKVFKNTVNDLIGDRFSPCQCDEKNRKNSLCPACQLFGTEKGSGYGSHIRFTDAILNDPENSILEKVTLKELGSPRTGFLPFYSINGLDYDVTGANINGRKFYWHNPAAVNDRSTYEVEKNKNEKRNERNSTVELLKNGTMDFDIYLDNVTKEQVNLIKWIVTLGENVPDSKYCYKIGHGKPLGLGSVKICISEEINRVINDIDEYSINKNSNIVIGEVPNGINKEVLKQVKKITDFNLLKSKEIRYPYISVDQRSVGMNLNENDVANHRWFTESKGSKSGKKAVLLPGLDKQSYDLHPYIIVPNKRWNSTTIDNNQFSKQNNKPRKTYEVGYIFEGEIYGFNKSGMFAKVKDKNGNEASFFSKSNKIGDIVQLEYDGKNEKGFDVWNLIQK